ncbi:MAG: 30S ribosomal protein S11 [Leptonema illini]|jgi:small subunit ribosomal protein S11|uniref:Small ribosomal subunit protein uS11 n=2 Tax=Leptonema illini TaxID=183 RepID=H2CAQ1_9LEPT|nr:30S ribosomal protein S11 [Leptonema illini]EHQ08429.1 30S ribosomal protein S11 [Leptonema illini DSM 21528]KAB2930187.1 MAG: 30S ribosomal protein S11 [Leptonema illini]PKL34837.1 MAG: 30S ribosomal protein S11 [Spirochaetae bacterium HGW-Spirochaetae-10]
MAKAPVRKKEKRSVPSGRVYINATFNNTIITVTDDTGNVIAWSSAGHLNFKGSRKSTPYAAQMAARDAAEKTRDFGLREVDVLVKGPGIGRESAIRAIANEGIRIRQIRDITPLPHNGCRPRKRRRV